MTIHQDDEAAAAAARDTLLAALRRLHLVEPAGNPKMTALSGGVSSDIWKVETSGGVYCAKRALPRLRVAELWEAPTGRSHNEAEWLRVAGRVRPASVPEVVAEDVEANVIVMPFLPPERYRNWKAALAAGDADPGFASQVGAVLGAIHAATAGDATMAKRFDTGGIFHAIRLEPYLEWTASRRPEVAQVLMRLSRETAATRLCLVHGDVSPKNMLVGPDGPVLLDAECAWFGDPAFDLAFVLNHLLLKCLWVPTAREGFMACFAALARTYVDAVDWEVREDLEARTAALLFGLMLARVDGKSPAEYLDREEQRDTVRRFAVERLLSPRASLARIADEWNEELGG